MKIRLKNGLGNEISIPEKQSPYVGKAWNLYEDGITQSMLSKFLECPEKFKNSYVESLVSISNNGPSMALDFGSFIHDVLDYVYSGFKDAEDQVEYYDSLQKIVPEIVAQYHDVKQEEAYTTGGDTQSLEMQTALAEVLMPIYFTLYKKDFLEMNWQSLEEVFDVKYDKLWGMPIRRRGKFDGVVRIAGKLWLFETKTKGKIVEENIAG